MAEEGLSYALGEGANCSARMLVLKGRVTSVGRSWKLPTWHPLIDSWAVMGDTNPLDSIYKQSTHMRTVSHQSVIH
jgi:hypothetical protein